VSSPEPLFWRNTVFYVFQTYGRMKGRDVLALRVESPEYSTPAIGIVPKLDGVPYLDAGVYRTKDGRSMSVCLVNRDVKREAQVAIDVNSPAWSTRAITTLTADSCKATNSPETPMNVAPQSKAAVSVKTNGKQLSMVLPRHSLTVIELDKGK